MKLASAAKFLVGLTVIAPLIVAAPHKASADGQMYGVWHTGNYDYWDGGGAPPACYGVIGGAPALGYPGAYYGYQFRPLTRFLASPVRPNYRPIYGEQPVPPMPGPSATYQLSREPARAGATSAPPPIPSDSAPSTGPIIPGTKPAPGPGSGLSPLPTVPKGPGQSPPGSSSRAPK
jgi:hypothetical protein